MANPSSISVRELPLFPLPEVVLFPDRPMPLHIFEPKYRLMVNTILDGDKSFGILLWDAVTGEPASVGCSAEITDFRRLSDGRLNIMTVGRQRFRVLEYIQETPYKVGLVEWIDDLTPGADVAGLSEEVSQLLKDIAYLLAKLTDKTVELPENLPESAEKLSFWVASNLYDLASEQQTLLELRDTSMRLKREVEILSVSRNQLAARTALKDAVG
ncbi:LON peptidase substrate-binding domain-containing protein [soil metagenome]